MSAEENKCRARSAERGEKLADEARERENCRQDAGATFKSAIQLVHLIGSMRVGGAEGQLVEIIKRLPRERFEQSLVLLHGEGALIGRARGEVREVVDVGSARRYGRLDPRRWLAPLGMLWRTWRYLRSRRPDILHAQLSYANMVGVLAGRLAGVPVILASQRQLSNYKQAQPVLRWVENAILRRATAMLVNSEAVRRDLVQRDGIAAEKIHRIYNGVVLGRFEPVSPEERGRVRRELGLAEGDLVLIVVANLHPYKGHDDLLRAMARLRGRFPNLRAILPGRDQGMGAKLMELARELGVEEAVHFLGERHDVPALLAAADIAVHPSREEGFSNSILEAMAAGRPLVATRVGGNVEQVGEGENGLLVAPQAPEELAAALEKLLGECELRRRMGEASRARIEREFSMERTVRDTQELYETLAGQTRRSV